MLVTLVMFATISCVLDISEGMPLESSYLDVGDTEIVGSVIREVRAVIKPQATEAADLLQDATDPDNFEHRYENDHGPSGYIRKNSDQGSDGYQHFDSFNKKDGNKYEFEHQTSFGHGAKDAKDGYQHHSNNKNNDGKSKTGKDENKAGTHNAYQVSENVSEYDPSYEIESNVPLYNSNYGSSGSYIDTGNSGESDQYNEEDESEVEDDGGNYSENESNADYDNEEYRQNESAEKSDDDYPAGYYSEGDSGESEQYTDGEYDY